MACSFFQRESGAAGTAGRWEVTRKRRWRDSHPFDIGSPAPRGYVPLLMLVNGWPRYVTANACESRRCQQKGIALPPGQRESLSVTVRLFSA